MKSLSSLNPEVLEIKSRLAAAKAKWRIASERADAAMTLFKVNELERCWALREVEKLEDDLEKAQQPWWRRW